MLYRARQFLYTEARLLERLVFAVRFGGASSEIVGRCVAAYQNPDGGLGHALEPDVRCPGSQPLFAEFGLMAMQEAGCRDRELALSVCSFLQGVSDAAGLVPTLLPDMLGSPRAAHWPAACSPGINPTAGICGLLHYQGIEHPWLSRATEACIELLLQDPPQEAHSLLCAARLAEHLPDRRSADRLLDRIAVALPEASFFVATAPVLAYGLTPLHFAPSPASPLRTLFTQEQIDGHLEELASTQQEDGGWPISWEPPGPAARSEWRGRWTLQALLVLAAYGWIDADARR
jgi:hypothetical protein